MSNVPRRELQAFLRGEEFRGKFLSQDGFLQKHGYPFLALQGGRVLWNPFPPEESGLRSLSRKLLFILKYELFYVPVVFCPTPLSPDIPERFPGFPVHYSVQLYPNRDFTITRASGEEIALPGKHGDIWLLSSWQALSSIWRYERLFLPAALWARRPMTHAERVELAQRVFEHLRKREEEMRALREQYRYLLKLAREAGLTHEECREHHKKALERSIRTLREELREKLGEAEVVGRLLGEGAFL